MYKVLHRNCVKMAKHVKMVKIIQMAKISKWLNFKVAKNGKIMTKW